MSVHNSLEPQNYDEAKGHDQWEMAMKVEYDALMRNNTWVLEELPLGKKPIGCEWAYRKNYNADGSLDKHKAMLVAKGFLSKR